MALYIARMTPDRVTLQASVADWRGIAQRHRQFAANIRTRIAGRDDHDVVRMTMPPKDARAILDAEATGVS